jgi:hypothetical protein
MRPNRIDFEVQKSKTEDDVWVYVKATRGILRATLRSLPIQLELISAAKRQVEKLQKEDVAYYHLVAKTIDLVHPGHHVLAHVLSYPLYAPNIVKNHLTNLGYESFEDTAGSFVHRVLDQMCLRLSKHCCAYWEFTISELAKWRVGISAFVDPRIERSKDRGFPGEDAYSFSVSNDGNVYSNNFSIQVISPSVFITSKISRAHNNIMRTYGFLMDLQAGTISLIGDDGLNALIFGKGASHFPEDEQERQIVLIQNRALVPCFSVQSCMYTLWDLF